MKKILIVVDMRRLRLKILTVRFLLRWIRMEGIIWRQKKGRNFRFPIVLK